MAGEGGDAGTEYVADIFGHPYSVIDPVERLPQSFMALAKQAGLLSAGTPSPSPHS